MADTHRVVRDVVMTQVFAWCGPGTATVNQLQGSEMQIGMAIIR